MKKLFVALIALALGMLTLSCVSPFYGTAKIEPGWHSDAGVAATTFIGGPIGESPAYYTGLRGDYELRYGFNKYLQVHGRVGLGLGYDFLYGSQPYTPGWDFSPLFDGAIGFQTSYPFKPLTPSVRIELSTTGVSPILLLGIGESDMLTLGADFTGLTMGFLSGIVGPAFSLGFDAFACFHISPRLSLFIGGGIPPTDFGCPYPLISLGLGYNLK